jgi:hypothetical protein
LKEKTPFCGNFLSPVFSFEEGWSPCRLWRAECPTKKTVNLQNPPPEGGESSPLHACMHYDDGNQTAMLAFEYSLGRVFLIGTHPEIEEDSNRDEVTFGDELNDEGSEWYIMQKVVFWLLEEG